MHERTLGYFLFPSSFRSLTFPYYPIYLYLPVEEQFTTARQMTTGAHAADMGCISGLFSSNLPGNALLL